MGIKIKSVDEIKTDIRTDINTDADIGVALYENSVGSDVFVTPLANQIYDTNIFQDFSSRCKSLTQLEQIVKDVRYKEILRYVLNLTYDEVLALISSAIDNLISNYNETRKPASKSRGYVRLYLNSANPITLSAGFSVETLNGIKFLTTNSFTAFVPSYDSTRGLYYIDSAVESVLTGLLTNVEPNTIVKLSSGIGTIVAVNNLYRTRFGRGQETDLEVIARVRNILASRNQSVFNGILSTILYYPGVVDAKIVFPGDDEMVRNEKNAVDIYILGDEKIETKSDIFNIFSGQYMYERIDNELDYEIASIVTEAESSKFKCLSQPVIALEAVEYANVYTGVYSDISGTLNKDLTGVFANSYKAHDYVSVPNELLSTSGFIKLTYSYDRLYLDLQNIVRNYNYYIIGADILFKKAIEKQVDISVIFYPLTGYNEDDIKATIISDLGIFFEGGIDSNGVDRTFMGLGDGIDLSDVENVILDVEGVDYIDLASFKLYVDDVEVSATRYIPLLSEYLRFNNISFESIGTQENGVNYGTLIQNEIVAE